ncbi:MAG: hypothetical protein UV05_C0033G0007 [candidate division CPR1 bacterium GW2011_GWA2_42_17]|uniref:Uncharacterized protein n=1 Tax=candidate division CPR1 bacterium GW2011_GWA2_42_17 TaxID=1618341 RepID=A0A0G0Z2Y2_9BACT|nr:MAG: hypothetical protein UV05_C0033G0007 [candidate division CPR1 bacterium GW2011_GWA2_42_17]
MAGIKSLILHKLVFFSLVLGVFWLIPLADPFYLQITLFSLALVLSLAVVLITMFLIVFVARINGIPLQQLPPLANLYSIITAFFMTLITLNSVNTIHDIKNLTILWGLSLPTFFTSLSSYVFFNVFIYAMFGYMIFRVFRIEGVKERAILTLNLIEIVVFNLLIFNFSAFGVFPLSF